jgi:glucose-1-phosphate thymidylyltransferase
MDIYVFEDSEVLSLGPLVAARPACDITIGTSTLYEILTQLGEVRRLLRPHLQQYIEDLAGTRAPYWGCHTDSKHTFQKNSDHVLVVNARLIPNRSSLVALTKLVDANRRGKISDGTTIVAALLDEKEKEKFTQTHLSSNQLPEELLDETDTPFIDNELQLIKSPEDFLTAHEKTIGDMIELAIDSGKYIELRPGIFQNSKIDSSNAARIDDFISVRSGPILIDENVTVGPFCCLDGPIKIGSGTQIYPHSWLRPATTIGQGCRIAGEVLSSVIENFSNKAHAGFLGHSHLGSWVNFGAGTTTSNLKVSYGPIRIRLNTNDIIQTQRQFFGTLCGDFTKTAIHTSLPCGALIGAAATLGGNVTNFIRPLSTKLGDSHRETTATIEQVVTTLDRMMNRRGIQLHQADRNLITALATLSKLPS